MDKTNCINCGKLIYENLKFCPYCRKKQASNFTDNELRKDPYQILQISRDAEQEVIAAAYKSLSKKYHPDVTSSINAHEKMKEINWAFSVLSNPEKRRDWESNEKKGERRQSSPGKQNSSPTSSTKSRVNHQGQDSNRKSTNQKKSKASPPIKNKKKKTSPGIKAFFLISGALILIVLFSLLSKPINPSAYNPPHNTPKPTSMNKVMSTREPTRIPTRTPKPPTATPLTSSIRLPYYESFTTDRGIWYVGDDDDASFEIANGEYLIKPKKPGGNWWTSPNADLDDVVLEFTTKFNYIYPSDDGGFFVNFRCTKSDEEQCYTLFVSEDGYLVIIYGDRPLVDHGFSEHIYNYNKPNRWAIVMHGNNYAVYCNDELITTFFNYNLRSGDFGFGVQNSKSEDWGFYGVTFDDIRILPINDSSSYRLPTPTEGHSFSDYKATMEAKGYRFVTPDPEKYNPNWANQTLQAP